MRCSLHLPFAAAAGLGLKLITTPDTSQANECQGLLYSPRGSANTCWSGKGSFCVISSWRGGRQSSHLNRRNDCSENFMCSFNERTDKHAESSWWWEKYMDHIENLLKYMDLINNTCVWHILHIKKVLQCSCSNWNDIFVKNCICS